MSDKTATPDDDRDPQFDELLKMLDKIIDRTNPRQYGLGDSTKLVRGVPRVKGVARDLPACPTCGCQTLFDIRVDIECAILVDGRGVGHYVGCAACPFASPMMIVSEP